MNNIIRTTLYLIFLTSLLVAVGAFVGGRQGVLVAFFFAVALYWVSFFNGEELLLWMYNARPLEGSDPYGLNRKIAELSDRLDVPRPSLYLIPSKTPNAMVAGTSAKRSSIALTEGLLTLLTADEVEAVLAQELSTVEGSDAVLMTITATLGTLVMAFVDFIMWICVFGKNEKPGRNFVGTLFLSVFAPIAAGLIYLGVNRSKEFQADSGSVHLTANPTALARALWKIHNYAGAKPLAASLGTAHLFIVNPLQPLGVNRLFSIQPPIEERLKRLVGKVI